MVYQVPRAGKSTNKSVVPKSQNNPSVSLDDAAEFIAVQMFWPEKARNDLQIIVAESSQKKNKDDVRDMLSKKKKGPKPGQGGSMGTSKKGGKRPAKAK